MDCGFRIEQTASVI